MAGRGRGCESLVVVTFTTGLHVYCLNFFSNGWDLMLS